jgi:hypothetical protein
VIIHIARRVEMKSVAVSLAYEKDVARSAQRFVRYRSSAQQFERDRFGCKKYVPTEN